MIQKIADNYNLKVIYDAAHAFGVRDEQGSILRHGDLSVLSFHATKVFNTFEGGAIVCPDAKTKLRLDRLKNFGYVDELTVVAPGINGKMSEINAALGLLQLKHVDAAILSRQVIDKRYRKALGRVVGITCLKMGEKEATNYSYFPILVEPDYSLSREDLYRKLQRNMIFGRRYFYPLISEFPIYRGMESARQGNLPCATSAASRVLCLPIYPGLPYEAQTRIIDLIAEGNDGAPNP